MKTKMTSYIVKLNENRIFFYLFPSDDSLAMVYIPKFIQFV